MSMSDREVDSESDAPEEYTFQEGMQQDEEIGKVQRENKARVVREGKERRRKWAQKLTARSLPKEESVRDEEETETHKESQANKGMLPDEIVKILAEREKLEPVILKNIPPPQCVQNSLEFLKKRKMQVPRSSAVLNNSNQALRLLSTSGLLK
ncbi:hypothetical protein Salat_1402400 [Sesamum alatum]|uniref:Uncharacterized protein n=1 Tax=Sesamum alatum TaxID=300844 RepID=A0AAE1Y9W4_9LAMI|nr:hypothetical protein Salat_1402400 [Sesamum alatum]